MPTQITEVVQHLRRAIHRHDEAGLTDGQLLGRFIEHRDEAAVAALVRRHGPMVWGVCRRILGTHHDAEDAFQATFLVLVRKAGSVRKREIVGNWLYGVAHRTALRTRATVAKQIAIERQVVDMPEPSVKEPDRSTELQAVLDQELSRLPDKYRVGIVLCDLEGKTRKEAARQLGLPEGTLAGRLTRGRAMLEKRLARHGLPVSGGTLAAVLSQQAASACVPTSVVTCTIKAVTLVATGQAVAGIISARAITLTEGVLKAMLMSKFKAVIAIVLVLGLLVAGAIGLASHTATAQTDKPPIGSDKPPIAEERVDSVEGTWEIVSAVYNGRPSPAMEKRKWTITKTYIEYDERTKDAYTINSKASPKWMDATQIRPGNKLGTAHGGKSLGIYEIKGDTLNMCVGHNNMRPKAFEGIAGQNLFTFKRVKTPQKQEPEQEKEGFTAWGKEIGGLQAGLGFLPGQKRAYSHGETVTVVARIRNVGKEAVEFKHIWVSSDNYFSLSCCLTGRCYRAE